MVESWPRCWSSLLTSSATQCELCTIAWRVTDLAHIQATCRGESANSIRGVRPGALPASCVARPRTVPSCVARLGTVPRQTRGRCFRLGSGRSQNNARTCSLSRQTEATAFEQGTP
eukprot:27772_3